MAPEGRKQSGDNSPREDQRRMGSRGGPAEPPPLPTTATMTPLPGTRNSVVPPVLHRLHPRQPSPQGFATTAVLSLSEFLLPAAAGNGGDGKEEGGGGGGCEKGGEGEAHPSHAAGRRV